MTSSPAGPQGLAGLVDDAGREAVRRVTRRSVAWWRVRTPEGRTRAAAVGYLVDALAIYGQAVEAAGGPEPADGYRVPPPPPREDALGDRLTVVSYDLVLALRAAEPDAPVRLAGEEATAAVAGAWALAECLLVTYEVDPRPVDGRWVDAALAGGAGLLAADLGRLPRLGET